MLSVEPRATRWQSAVGGGQGGGGGGGARLSIRHCWELTEEPRVAESTCLGLLPEGFAFQALPFLLFVPAVVAMHPCTPEQHLKKGGGAERAGEGCRVMLATSSLSAFLQ